MTDLNKYNPMPSEVAIRCPRCQSEAAFHVAFTFLNAGCPALKARQAAGLPLVQWGGWHIIEHFPDLFPWEPPQLGGFRETEWGVCVCPACVYRAKHCLAWPDDAYYQCEVRGQTLWAWTRGCVVALRRYIAATDRKDFTPYTGCFLFLRHIPKAFLLAKNRDAVLKQLDRLLHA